ncbi:CdaR family transcriptional regulator [Amycolatopsis decaplanina DSM 44594]|uniref:CdaR family transcriptional regulator n=1 Tax=Amycolatopsis decaplanina DSM 44594 TaxID=1284240 RepID=M2WUK5_9PSEU|nr:CdaR family transcriptional regulator [Amycolatopsis decaplanina DSM 44594]
MLGFYQSAALGVWRQLTSAAPAVDLPTQAIVELGEALFAFIAELSAAAADGYAEARSQAARAGQARRDRLLGLLLAEPAAARDVLDDAANQAAWILPGRLVIAVTSADVAPRLLDRMPGRVLIGRHHDLTAVVMPADRLEWYLSRLRDLLGGEQAGVGPVVPLRSAALSARRKRPRPHHRSPHRSAADRRCRTRRRVLEGRPRAPGGSAGTGEAAAHRNPRGLARAARPATGDRRRTARPCPDRPVPDPAVANALRRHDRRSGGPLRTGDRPEDRSAGIEGTYKRSKRGVHPLRPDDR